MRRLFFSYLLPALLCLAWANVAHAQVQKTQEIGATAGANVEVLVTNLAGGTYMPPNAGNTDDSPLTGRRGMKVQNLGPNPIYCTEDGQAPLATGALGTRILPGDTVTLWASATQVVRCIAATAAQVTTAATQVSQFR